MPFSIRYVVWLFILLPSLVNAASLSIHHDYPGANIVVDRIAESEVFLRQDLRGTREWWFYWNFAALAPAGSEITFHLVDGNVIGTRGPAVSEDGGLTWRWLGTETVQSDKSRASFRYRIGDEGAAVRFAFAPPYQLSDLQRFLATFEGDPALVVETLCTSEQGRAVPRLRLGQLQRTPDYRVLLTARHHSCESMASYVLEGLMQALLSKQDESGPWFREHVEVLVIPFVDLDGVEAGDQGKNRPPRDHGRDYAGESIYRSTRALRAWVPDWSGGRLCFTLDLHCPHIRGADNERVYQVGHPLPEYWEAQQQFARLLEAVSELPLPYAATNDLPFGQSWNQSANYTEGAGIFHWTASLEGVRFASAMEIPYANAEEVTVTPERARAYGAAILHAIRGWLIRPAG